MASLWKGCGEIERERRERGGIRERVSGKYARCIFIGMVARYARYTRRIEIKVAVVFAGTTGRAAE